MTLICRFHKLQNFESQQFETKQKNDLILNNSLCVLIRLVTIIFYTPILNHKELNVLYGSYKAEYMKKTHNYK